MQAFAIFPNKFLALLAGVFVAILGQNAQSAVVINASETGGNVELVASGVLDLTGLNNFSLSSAYQQVIPGQGYLVTGPFAGSGVTDLYNGLVGPSTFGSGGQTLASSATGTRLAITNYGQWLAVTNGFPSGSSVSSTTVFNGATFASLGMEPGTYVWSWSNDSVTLNVPGAVPVPAAVWLFGSALLCLAGVKRKYSGQR